MRASDARGHSVAGDLDRDVVALACHAGNAAVNVGLDALAAQDVGDPTSLPKRL